MASSTVHFKKRGNHNDERLLEKIIGPPMKPASAGHDMIFLDYRECGPNGNPKVVHVEQEFDYKITELADDFETFIEMLQNEGDFE